MNITTTLRNTTCSTIHNNSGNNNNSNNRRTPQRYKLKVLQQPSKARLCSFKEKVDRRPIDPPPIIQLYCACHQYQQRQQCQHNSFLHNPYFFLYANLTSITDDTDLYIHHGHRTTAGAVVQSLHKLKDTDNNDGGFFVFADISVRLEGNYRLKFTLFEIAGEHVQRLVSVVSNPFTVYSPKYFPGMSESSLLTKSFSDQGVRIRIRKDTRHTAKRQKTSDPIKTDIKTEENHSLSSEKSPRSPLILPPLSSNAVAAVVISSPSSSSSSSSTSSRAAMSMQHILSPPLNYDHQDFYTTRTLPPPTRLLSHPLPPMLPPQFPDSPSDTSSAATVLPSSSSSSSSSPSIIAITKTTTTAMSSSP